MMKNAIPDAATPKHPKALWVLKALLFMLGISAIIPGIELMLDPSGQGVQFPPGYLQGSPFSNYFIPGLLLSTLIGLPSLVAWWGLWKITFIPSMEKINPIAQRHWAWTLGFATGCVLIGWIIIQMLMVPYFFLQPVLLVWGVLIVLLCYKQDVQAYYKKAKKDDSVSLFK